MATNPSVIAPCLPALISAERELSRLAAERGILYRIADFGSVRTQSDTTLILKYREQDYAKYAAAEKAAGRVPVSIEKFRPIAAYGSSYHNYGAAFDVLITKVAPGKTADQSLAILGELAPLAGLRWGGTFSNPDRPHFELQLPLDQVRSMWTAYTAKGATPIAIVGGIAILGLLFMGMSKWLR